jgi:hypothetical protein
MNSNDETMTTGAWFLTLLVLAVPVLNVIMYIIWALGAGNQNRATFCRASILWVIVGVIVYGILIATGIGITQTG